MTPVDLAFFGAGAVVGAAVVGWLWFLIAGRDRRDPALRATDYVSRDLKVTGYREPRRPTAPRPRISHHVVMAEPRKPGEDGP